MCLHGQLVEFPYNTNFELNFQIIKSRYLWNRITEHTMVTNHLANLFWQCKQIYYLPTQFKTKTNLYFAMYCIKYSVQVGTYT